jgi:hypothetical protein
MPTLTLVMCRASSAASSRVRCLPRSSSSSIACSLRLDEPDPLEPAGQADDRLRRQDLPRDGEAAQTGCGVQRPAAVATLDRHRLSSVDTDPHRKSEDRTILDTCAKRALELDGGAKRLTRRAEHRQGLVAAELDQLAVEREDHLACKLSEERGKPTGFLVAVLLRETRVATEISNQEGQDRGRRRPAAPARVRRLFHSPAYGCSSYGEESANPSARPEVEGVGSPFWFELRAV